MTTPDVDVLSRAIAIEPPAPRNHARITEHLRLMADTLPADDGAWCLAGASLLDSYLARLNGPSAPVRTLARDSDDLD